MFEKDCKIFCQAIQIDVQFTIRSFILLTEQSCLEQNCFVFIYILKNNINNSVHNKSYIHYPT